MWFFLTALLVASGLFVQPVIGANSWAGSNNYYAYALPDGDRAALLDAMQAAGMKVLRTWVTGLGAGQKGSDSAQVNDLEHNGIGTYDDDVLNRIDQLMVDAQSRGIKLLISMHDVNALESPDEYGSTYGTSGFYTNADAINNFNQRITHILNIHKNSLVNNQPWSELSEYIFGFEPQNEPMIFDQSLYTSNLAWICNAAQQIRNNVGNPDILIHTGGGSGSASVQSFFFGSSCPGIDVVAIHDYNEGVSCSFSCCSILTDYLTCSDWDNFVASAISQAQSAGKKLIAEEWGSLVGSGRTANLQSNAQKINSFGVPWLYWQLITNIDPHQGEDYEIEVNGDDWNTISGLAEDAAGVSSPFDFTTSLAV